MKYMLKSSTLGALGICLMLSACSHVSREQSKLVLVQDGRANAEIVVAADAAAGSQRAAEDLQDYLEQISGAKLTIVHVPSTNALHRLYVGESEFTRALGYALPEFSNSGYDVLVTDDYAVFAGPQTLYGSSAFDASDPQSMQAIWDRIGFKCGFSSFGNGAGAFNQPLNIFCNDDIGPWHAVGAFLETLGVRFYAPYEDGTIVPKMQQIAIPVGRSTHEAAYGRRHWTYYNAMRSDRDGIAWLKHLKCGNRTGIIYNHTTIDLLSNPETVEAHPEWLAEESPGKKFSPRHGCLGLPRFTDAGFQQACVAWARALLDTYPHLSAITLGAPDGGNPYDWRDRQQYETDGISASQGYANMMWDFHCAIARELKKSHPDKGLIWWCQYNNSIPSLIDTNTIPDNLVFPGGYSSPHNTVLDTSFQAWKNDRKTIADIFHPTMKGPAWEYWLPYRSQTNPRYPMFFGRRLQEIRQFGRDFVDGVFMEVTPAWLSSGTKGEQGFRIGEVPITHLMMYVNMKLLWNPDLDLDALLNEYYRLWYGPAEAAMKDFHEFAEQVWCRQESRSVTETNGFLKEDDVPKYFEKLAAAKALTEPGTLYYQRIEAMEEGFAPLKKLFPSIMRQGAWVRAYPVPESFPLDGDLSKYPCNAPPAGKEPYDPPIGFGWHSLRDHSSGDPLRDEEAKTQGTRVSVNFQPDSRTLCIAAICYEPDMDALAASTVLNDDLGIFQDDVLEIYLDSPERSYFKVVVNTKGAIWDESQDQTIIARDTLPLLWDPGCQAIVKKYDNRWEVEVRIPCKDLGVLGPTQQYPWGLQIGRTRIANLGSSSQRTFSLAPTGGAYKIQSKWARIWLR